MGYRIELADDFYIEPQAGVYTSYATAGNFGVEGSLGFPPFFEFPINEKESFNYQDDFKRLDFGLTGGISLEFKNIFLRYNFNYGLMKITQSNFLFDVDLFEDGGDFLDDGDGFDDFDLPFNQFEAASRFSAIQVGYRIRF